MVASNIFPPRFANNRQLLLRNSAASQWKQTKQSDPGQGKRSAHSRISGWLGLIANYQISQWNLSIWQGPRWRTW